MLEAISAFLARGLGDFSYLQVLIITLVMVQVTIAGVTLFLHRSQAHRGVDFHPVISHFFRFWLWLTTGMITKEWVAVHRKHHATCETEEDPHSPKYSGIRKVLLDGVDLYRKGVTEETLERFGHGTPDDALERFYTKHRKLGIYSLLTINILLFGGLGLAVWALQMMWIPFWAAGMINGTAHYVGYRNYETPDWSTNITPIAFWIGGEELHNNHHAFPSSAKFSTKWYEFDIGWLYIQIFRLLGLAKVKRLTPKVRIKRGKDLIDLETIKAVITNRVHVMANYARQVIKPTVEKNRTPLAERFGLRRIRKLLSKEHSMMDDKSEQELNEVLNDNSTLKTIYNFRIQLQQIWDRAACSHENLLQALKEWCKQAEATGIKSLQDFARSLRNYGVSQATA